MGLGAFAAAVGGRLARGAVGDAGALPRLRDVAAARGITYGAHPFAFPPDITPEMTDLTGAHCAVIAPVLNWRLLSPRPGALNLAADRGVSALARRLCCPLTGGHLLWHEEMPAWFAGLPGKREKEAAALGFIRDAGRAYGPSTWSVNVLNEALAPEDGLAGGIRRSVLSEAFGSSCWEWAFHAAREAFPDSLLVYNDYGLEQEHRHMTAKRRALLARLDAMRASGTPLDAVGLQSHLELRQRFDDAGFTRFLGQVAERGVLIILSELDVLDVGAPTDIAERDRQVAELYGRYLQAALAEPAVVGVVTWGLSDRTTWLNARRSPRFARRDGLPSRPLPFDDALRPTPAFWAIEAAFRQAGRRTYERPRDAACAPHQLGGRT